MSLLLPHPLTPRVHLMNTLFFVQGFGQSVDQQDDTSALVVIEGIFPYPFRLRSALQSPYLPYVFMKSYYMKRAVLVPLTHDGRASLPNFLRIRWLFPKISSEPFFCDSSLEVLLRELFPLNSEGFGFLRKCSFYESPKGRSHSFLEWKAVRWSSRCHVHQSLRFLCQSNQVLRSFVS